MWFLSSNKYQYEKHVKEDSVFRDDSLFTLFYHKLMKDLLWRERAHREMRILEEILE